MYKHTFKHYTFIFFCFGLVENCSIRYCVLHFHNWYWNIWLDNCIMWFNHSLSKDEICDCQTFSLNGINLKTRSTWSPDINVYGCQVHFWKQKALRVLMSWLKPLNFILFIWRSLPYSLMLKFLMSFLEPSMGITSVSAFQSIII